jgi:hypothetical protein
MEQVKHGIDAISAGAVLASLAHALPEVMAFAASGLSAAWYVIRIYEWWKTKQVKA